MRVRQVGKPTFRQKISGASKISSKKVLDQIICSIVASLISIQKKKLCQLKQSFCISFKVQIPGPENLFFLMPRCFLKGDLFLGTNTKSVSWATPARSNTSKSAPEAKVMHRKSVKFTKLCSDTNPGTPTKTKTLKALTYIGPAGKKPACHKASIHPVPVGRQWEMGHLLSSTGFGQRNSAGVGHAQH